MFLVNFSKVDQNKKVNFICYYHEYIKKLIFYSSWPKKNYNDRNIKFERIETIWPIYDGCNKLFNYTQL